METDVAAVIAALRAGEVVIVPTDTVYGLAADGLRREPVERLYRLKGRSHAQPSGLVMASVEVALELVPELRSAEPVLRELLPGPYTLVLPNPARRFPWLTGGAARGDRNPRPGGGRRTARGARRSRRHRGDERQPPGWGRRLHASRTSPSSSSSSARRSWTAVAFRGSPRRSSTSRGRAGHPP